MNILYVRKNDEFYFFFEFYYRFYPFTNKMEKYLHKDKPFKNCKQSIFLDSLLHFFHMKHIFGFSTPLFSHEA